MNMGRFTTITGIKEKAVWANEFYGRHDRIITFKNIPSKLVYNRTNLRRTLVRASGAGTGLMLRIRIFSRPTHPNLSPISPINH